jgi:3-methylcrotonyl-CoA carboxylase alpha subunit
MFNKVLIANRGEIACRVLRTCKRLGIRTIAVYSDADAQAQHVLLADEAIHIGGARPKDSYLRGDAILAAARAGGAQAIHPGYGFLSENASFARACAKAGVAFIGPSPNAIQQMGSKSAAKRLMERAGVPVVPGYHGEAQDLPTLQREAQRIGCPLLIKAVAGGGGKGMRLVSDMSEFSAQLDAAKREAMNAFGDDSVLLERFVREPHHIEFQVFGDTHGDVVHLFERECSIQRRHQKVLEETPSPFLDDALRSRMAQAAVAAAKAIDYVNAGTIEFIVGADRQFYFMEMNTRLQVEHPITEMTTGLDLVEWQLRVAAGEPLPLKQEQIARSGHAIEVRICAENPAKDFLPDTGTLLACQFPALEQVRIDTGVVGGDEISMYYDSMIAKLIACGEDRGRAIARLRAALAHTAIIGPNTNLALLQQLAGHAAFAAGHTDTHFIERHRAELLPVAAASAAAALAAALVLEHRPAETAAQPQSPWQQGSGWRMNAPSERLFHLREQGSGAEHLLRILRAEFGAQAVVDTRTHALGDVLLRAHELSFTLDGTAHRFHHARAGGRVALVGDDARYEFEHLSLEAEFSHAESSAGRLTALMPGRIVKVLVGRGTQVKQGQALLIMEAMKMEHTITSPRDGVIARVLYAPDETVAADALLVTFEE